MDTFFTFNRSYCTRGHIYRLSYFLCILVSMYINIFSNRVVELWNSLPADQPRHFFVIVRYYDFCESVDLSKFVQQ